MKGAETGPGPTLTLILILLPVSLLGLGVILVGKNMLVPAAMSAFLYLLRGLNSLRLRREIIEARKRLRIARAWLRMGRPDMAVSSASRSLRILLSRRLGVPEQEDRLRIALASRPGWLSALDACYKLDGSRAQLVLEALEALLR